MLIGFFKDAILRFQSYVYKNNYKEDIYQIYLKYMHCIISESFSRILFKALNAK